MLEHKRINTFFGIDESCWWG